MRCFNHSTVEGVGVCRSCGRALCHDCIAEVGLSCSCKGRCEPVVATMNDLVQRGGTAYQKTSAAYFRNGILIVLFGGVFAAVGIAGVASHGSSIGTYFMIVAGMLFSGMGISSIIAARRFRQK